jgi:hypothetical protein
LEGGNKQKSLEYWQKAGELYARAGVSPLFIAGQFRRLTTSEVLTLGDSERMVRLNDLTNQYLALAGCGKMGQVLLVDVFFVCFS